MKILPIKAKELNNKVDMKNLFFLTLLITIIACATIKQNVQLVKKLEIIRVDSTNDHFIFKTKNESDYEIIVLAEKDKVNDCQPFKKFIIEDSIHQTSTLKAGAREYLVGFYLSTINGIKIRNSGELVKIIWNCDCFTNK